MSAVLQKFIMTIPRKKTMFASILSDELKDCAHRINIRYDWNRSDKLFTIGVSKNNSLELIINLNTGSRLHFDNRIDGTELELIYRAYFISTYIHCLEEAATSVPQPYFYGLVWLCALNSLCKGKNTKVFSPIERKPRELRPIDVYCAICSLIRLAADHVDKLSMGLRDDLNSIIRELLIYSTLPEIGYKGGTPIYALLQEVRELHENIMSHRCDLANYAFFDKVSSYWLNNLSTNDLASISENTHNAFLGNLAIRLSAHLGQRIDIANDQESFITSCIQRFEEDAVKYYLDTKRTENLLLLDNFLAIKNLSQKSEHVFSKVAANSGKIHRFS